MKCGNCGAEVNEGAKFCRECGKEVVDKTEALEQNICFKCGNILEKHMLFCNNCGQRVLDENYETEVSNRCPNCNNHLNAHALFCGKCGASITGAPVQQTEGNKPTKKKRDSGLIFLIVLLIIVLIGSICVIGYVYSQNAVEIEMPDINVGIMSEESESSAEEEVEDLEEVVNYQEAFTDEEEKTEEYLFPSDSEYITELDLIGKTKDEVAMMRNEIYARRGYIFNTEPFKSYFESQEWYEPNENFNEAIFSEIEKTNKDFLVNYEIERGWR